MYRADTYPLIKAGLVGGKLVASTFAQHPCVFLTATAPSFGPVHSTRAGRDDHPRPCRPRRLAETCSHGRSLRCTAGQKEGDPLLGRPFCLDCYDHPGQVVWNAYVTELWRRSLLRANKTLKPYGARASFAKVAEMQARGVVHRHDATGTESPATSLISWSRRSRHRAPRSSWSCGTTKDWLRPTAYSGAALMTCRTVGEDDARMRPRILIVDDHVGFRTVARAMLQSEGFEVVGEAAGGGDALAAVARLRPEIVLLDIHLPDMDGFEVSHRIAALPSPPVVVLISSRPITDLRRQVADSPVAGFIAKHELSAAAVAALAG